MKRELDKKYQREAIKASVELNYPYGVQRALGCARNTIEISRIMAKARQMS